MVAILREVRRHTRVRTYGFRLMEMGVWVLCLDSKPGATRDCTDPPARVAGRTRLPTKADFADHRS